MADEARYTREEVDTAADAAVDMLIAELGLGDRDIDLLRLACAAVAGKLADSAATLDNVVECSYDGVSTAELKSWWNGWS